MFKGIFNGKSVVVTGHTGFKGSWLAAWLIELGARVTGISDAVPTSPSHFECAGLGAHLTDVRLDIRDRKALRGAIHRARPDFVFHLAAQPLVRRSYREPIDTLAVNVMGTAHLLDALRTVDWPCVAVMITSDKCYDNVEWVWGYRETDRLGGKDPYSASKGAAELVIRTYACSYFQEPDGPVRLAVGRAGNVIGGGDWAEDRIVPDSVRAWAENRSVEIRNPHATRPWQHVLEPLSGYLTLGAQLAVRPEMHGEPFNFGPSPDQNFSVQALLAAMVKHWPGAGHTVVMQPGGSPEAGLLKLDCDKALSLLGWRATLDFPRTVVMTTEWYRRYYEHPGASMLDVTRGQIADYVALAREGGAAWAR
ncbi:MAG TPA: CDP-glucose 4,6-dehydratase [Sedimenticola sp.]|nr:CDP-glucose 4,6-dehydratase [Sedimenticola sp.]